jgi:cell division protein FtsI (penicillin-binding protein 3)
LLDRSQIELPEIAAPRYPKQWKDINTATIGYGHGIAVSPVQLCAGIASLINGGFWRSPTLLVENEKLNPAERVVSKVTSRAMRQLLRLVVTRGTGQSAEVAGYSVGGKTGTAEKVKKGKKGYDRNRVLSSFVGVFPITAPRYLVLVMLDEPKGVPATHGYATGGWTAAPVVGRVIARIGPMSGIAPAVEGTAKGDFSTTVVMLDGDEIRLAAY